MPYIHAGSRLSSRSPPHSPPAAATTTATAPLPVSAMSTHELKNANSAGLALAGVPRRRLHLAFGGFSQPVSQPVPASPPTPEPSTSLLPTPDSSAQSTPSPSPSPPPQLSRTSSPARSRPTFSIGSPKDDHRHSPVAVAARRLSGSSQSQSSSDSEDDNDALLKFGRLHVRNVDGVTVTSSAGAHWRERLDLEEQTTATEDSDKPVANQRDSGFFDATVGSTDEEEDESTPEALPQPTRSKPTPPPIDLSIIHAPDSVPFPSADDAPGVPFPTGSGPPSPNVLPRTPSTPIILSNGKPLKSSLKSSASSPNFAPLHLRSRSAPSTPGNLVLSPITPKNVHFPSAKEDLQHVRLFRPAGRPTAVSFDRGAGGGDETETETEGYESTGYPFPVTPPVPREDSIIVLHTGLTSPVPAPSSTHHPGSGGGGPAAAAVYANVHLETLQLPKTRPYTLVGSVLVRNVAYNKTVAIRFTLDDWQTTSEVTAHYVSSLPSLPPPFHEARSSPLVGDAITSLSHAGVGWDRFGWQVKLEDVTERRLAEKTLYLVVRFSAQGDGGGEWWDNNNGANYRVVFRKEAAAPSKPGALSPSNSRALANQIRAENRAGGLPPLQLKARRPGLGQPSLSFGSAPRSVGGGGRNMPPAMDFGQQQQSASAPNLHQAASAGGEQRQPQPHSPVSPIRGLNLKNYCPPGAKTPPAATPTTPTQSVTQQPSPPRSPVRTNGPTILLTTREVVFDGGQPISVPVPFGASGATVPSTPPMNHASPAVASPSVRAAQAPPSIALPARPLMDFSRGPFSARRLEDNSPSFEGVLNGSNNGSPNGVLNNSVAFPMPMSPIGSPGTNASYEALVKQWCFGGSSANGAVAVPAGGFADQSQHVATFGPTAAPAAFNEQRLPGTAGAGFMSFGGLPNGHGIGHGKSASEPQWFGRLVAGETA